MSFPNPLSLFHPFHVSLFTLTLISFNLSLYFVPTGTFIPYHLSLFSLLSSLFSHFYLYGLLPLTLIPLTLSLFNLASLFSSYSFSPLFYWQSIFFRFV